MPKEIVTKTGEAIGSASTPFPPFKTTRCAFRLLSPPLNTELN